MKIVGFIVFLLIPILGNVYVLWHVWRILPFPVWAKAVVVSLMIVAFLLLFVGVSSMAEHLPMGWAVATYEIGTSWLFILLYLFMLFLLMDILKWVHVLPASFLQGSMKGTLFVLFLMIGVFVYGNWHYHNKHRELLTIQTDKTLKKPVKIVMLSDLHLGYHNRLNELHRWINLINDEHPDLVLVAGDIIDRHVRPLLVQNMAAEFHRLNVPVVACLGNHEYYAGESDSQNFFDEAGILLLRDSIYNYGDLCIIGRDDRTNLHRLPLSHLMEKVDKKKFSILLDHQPYHLEEAEKAQIDFQLSGHTHDGQVWPVSLITAALYEKSFGSYRRGNTQYYITSGMGIWGGKFRIGTRSEYVVAEILPNL